MVDRRCDCGWRLPAEYGAALMGAPLCPRVRGVLIMLVCPKCDAAHFIPLDLPYQDPDPSRDHADEN